MSWNRFDKINSGRQEDNSRKDSILYYYHGYIKSTPKSAYIMPRNAGLDFYLTVRPRGRGLRTKRLPLPAMTDIWMQRYRITLKNKSTPESAFLVSPVRS